MAKRIVRLFLLAAFCLLGSAALLAQVTTVGTLTGTVADQTGAVVAGASIKVRDDATGSIIETKSGADGLYTVGNLKPGTYTVTVTLQGFKTAENRLVKVTVAQVTVLNVAMEVGALESTVVVEAGAEVLETASTNIGTTITGKAITQLPFTSRDALDLAILMPGAQTVGRPRATSFMGLPKGAVNITMDGINAQDNYLKSSDGFFTLIRPRVDAVEEFSVTTATSSADASSEGAVTIRFETKRGGNAFHGGGWWYHRNDYFNSNYYFSNQSGQARQRMRLNQFGYKVGGPILREKIFFYTDLDIFRLPQSQFRSRTMVTPEAAAGTYRFATAAAIPSGTALPGYMECGSVGPGSLAGVPTVGTICSVRLVGPLVAPFTATWASSFTNSVTGLPFEDSIDTTVGATLTALLGARTAPGVTVRSSNLFQDLYDFNNPGDDTRRFPVLRLDWNITKNIAWNGVMQYNFFDATVDFLNGADPTFPVAPFNSIYGDQRSNRTQIVSALRWNLAANKSNEFRVGIVSAPVGFFRKMDPTAYPTMPTNLGTLQVRPSFPLISAVYGPFAFQPGGRNSSIRQFIDNFSWTRGRHSLSFGGNFTYVSLTRDSGFGTIPGVNIGVSTNDPMNNAISSSSILGTGTSSAGTTVLANARSLYALLTGRVTSTDSGLNYVDVESKTYVSGQSLRRNIRQREFGFYGQDSWRMRSDLTVNLGLRWEIQGAPYDPNQITLRAVGGFDGVFGVSGPGNLFQPGTLTGSVTSFELNNSREWYRRDMNNFAPSIGLAWTPHFNNKLWNTVMGEAGKSVIRLGYSINYTREGINNFESIAFSNPGPNASYSTSNASGSTCASPGPGQFRAGCLFLSSPGGITTFAQFPAAFGPTQPIQPYRTAQVNGVNAFVPNLGTPYSQSWQLGIQRELSPNLVVEVRYVGTKGTGLWRQININEIDTTSNGFLTEFMIAKNNLAICRANQVACRTAAGSTSTTFASFANWGLAGQAAVPILTQAFTGSTAGTQANSNFSGAFLTNMDNNTVGALAGTISGNLSMMCNLAGQNAYPSGICATVTPAPPLVGTQPVNFFVANPHATGGAFQFSNDTHTNYHGLQIEVRRRMANGLQFSANYSFSKSLSNYFADSASSFSGFTALRNRRWDRGPAPFDIRHQIKAYWLYEMPFGPGRKWSSGAGWFNRIIEGWEFQGITRWQTGRVFNLTSNLGGTYSSADPGMELVGISVKQLQKMLDIRKTTIVTSNGTSRGAVFYLPPALVNVSVSTSSFTSTLNTAFLKPCSTAGALCQKVFLYGPQFFRADLNIVKKIRITERINIEYRAEFLNAFNNINFFVGGSAAATVGSAASNSTSFGQVFDAYQDTSTTNDVGGRMIQMVLRINF